MNVNQYIGFDVHKKTVSYCVKAADGRIVEEGKLRATRDALRQWARERHHGFAVVAILLGLILVHAHHIAARVLHPDFFHLQRRRLDAT
jgi:hypothetical protein